MSLYPTHRAPKARRRGAENQVHFSMPKSISIVAQVGDDQRLNTTHEVAVLDALACLEKTHGKQ